MSRRTVLPRLVPWGAHLWLLLAVRAEKHPLERSLCSPKGHDCRSTGCCQEPDNNCYMKDYFFAACRPNCTPGIFLGDPVDQRQPWSCKRLQPPECAEEKKSCKDAMCCSGLSCYEKDSTWQGCKKGTCVKGPDPTDPPAYQTPWSCKLIHERTPAKVAEAAEQPDLVEEPADKPAAEVHHSFDDLHCAKDGNKGLLKIDGMEGETYAEGGGGEVSEDGKTLTLHHNAGYSVMTTCRKNWAPDEFMQLKLMGKTISFTVDLSKVGCACNLAFYLVSAAALDVSGKPSKGECDESAYYCDANKVCGQWCPEVDIMEANNHVFQATPHKCDDPNAAGHYANCDRSGCAQNTRTFPNMYGPGAGNTINTLLPFNVSTHFPGWGTTLTGFVTTMTQGTKKAVLDHKGCSPSYLAQVGKAVALGMSLRITYWGYKDETMAWMDKPPCGTESCTGDNAGDGIFSNLRVDPPQQGAPIRRIPGFTPLPKPLPFVEPTKKPTPEPTKPPEPSTKPADKPSPKPTPKPTEKPDDFDQTHCGNPDDKVSGPLQMLGVEGATYAQGGGGSVSSTGGSLMLHHNSGYSVMTTCRKKWAPDEFVQLKLVGRTISFTVDLSKVGCACNLAFYLVSSAALDFDGTPSLGECKEARYYCDANRVCGQWCPEIDIMEANNRVFQSTPHKCDDPSPQGHYSSCDRSGCAQNTKTMPNMYGPGAGFTINTLLPFNVSTSFPGQGTALTGFVTTLYQGDKKATLPHPTCDQGYLAQVGKALALGMSLRITYWGSDDKTMAWMDKPPCGTESCTGANAGSAVISGIRLDPPQPGAPIRRIPGFTPLPQPLPFREPATTTKPPASLRTTVATSATPPAATSQTPNPWALASTSAPVGEPALPTEAPEAEASRTSLAKTLLAVGGGILGLFGLYFLAVLVFWCFPALGPSVGADMSGVARVESALYASGASSRELLSRTPQSTSGLKWAVHEANFLVRRLCCGCCCCRPTLAKTRTSEAELTRSGISGILPPGAAGRP